MWIENNSEYRVKSWDSLTKIVVLNFWKETWFPMEAVTWNKINWKDPNVKAFMQDTNKSDAFWQKVNILYSQTKDYSSRKKKWLETSINYENWTGFDTPKSRLKREKKKFTLLAWEKLQLAKLRNELDPNTYINEALPISRIESPLEIKDKASREKAIWETQEIINTWDTENRKDAVDTALKIPHWQEIINLDESKKEAIENLEKGLYGSEVESLDESDLKAIVKDKKVWIDSLAFWVDWEWIDEWSWEDDASLIIKANDDLKYDMSIRNDNSYRYDSKEQKFVKVLENETKNYLTNEAWLNWILEIRKQILVNRLMHQMYRNNELDSGLIKNHSSLYQKILNSDEKKLRTIVNWKDNQSYDNSQYYSRFHKTFTDDIPTEVLFDSYDKIITTEAIKDEKGNSINYVEDIIWDKKNNQITLKVKNRETWNTWEEKI